MEFFFCKKKNPIEEKKSNEKKECFFSLKNSIAEFIGAKHFWISRKSFEEKIKY